MKSRVLFFIVLIFQLLFGCTSKEKRKEKAAKVAKERLEEYLQKNDSIRVLNDSNYQIRRENRCKLKQRK